MTDTSLPNLHINFRARLGDTAEISISGSDVALVSAAMLHFGLGVANAAPAPAAAEAPAEKTPAQVAERLSKKARAKKEEVAQEPVEKTADELASAPASPEPTPSPSEPAEAPAASAEAPAAVAPSATPEEAAAAVKAYGAKHGIDAARALLQKFGFARTGDITPEKAGEVVAAAGV